MAGRERCGLDWPATLAREVGLRRRQGMGPGTGFDSLHVGGPEARTPSPRDLIRFLELSGVSPNSGAELAMEVRPDDVDEVRVEGWIRAGVTRLSLREPMSGVPEGWPDRVGLTRLSSWGVDVAFGIHGHGRDDGSRGPSGVDFGNVGVPGRAAVRSSLPETSDVLDAVIRCWAPPQVSLVEEEVRGDRAGSLDPQESGPEAQDQLADLYLDLTRRLEEAGYRQWAFTAFALPGSEPRHQRAVLQGEPYLGLGPGAHSRGKDRRFWNMDDPTAYSIRLGSGLDPRAGHEVLTTADRILEGLCGLLSLDRGLDLSGPGLHDPRRIRDRWISVGWARPAGECLRLTPAGWLVMDTLIPELAGSWPGDVVPVGGRLA